MLLVEEFHGLPLADRFASQLHSSDEPVCFANQPNPFGKSNRRGLSNPVPVAYWLSSRSPICNWRFCSSNLA